MKILTAMGDESLNTRLKDLTNDEIIEKDIQYQDGIIEILELEKDINLIILNAELPGEYEFKDFINKIINIKKEIKLIVFFKEKNIDLENFLISKNIYRIYEFSEEGFELFLSNFEKNKNNNLAEEINSFKNIILNKNNKKIVKKAVFGGKKRKKIKRNIHNKFPNCETIVISGVPGSGKSIISLIIGNIIKNRKTILIDFDKLNTTIKYFYKIKNQQFSNNYEDYIFKINNNLDIFVNLNELLNHTSKELEYDEIRQIISNLKEKYDFIIIDTSTGLKDNEIKSILYFADKIIFLIEPNILEIRKAKDLLEFYINDFNVNIDKIKIVFNKTNKYKIAESILEEIFDRFEILGNIEYDEKLNLMINRGIIDKNNLEKITEKIIN